MPSNESRILAQKHPAPPTAGAKKLRRWVALASLPLLGMAAVYGVAPTAGEVISTQEVAAALTLQPLESVRASSADEPLLYWRQVRVVPGDTLASLLARLEVNTQSAQNLLREIGVSSAKMSRQLIPGRSVYAQTDAAGGLLLLRYPTGSSSGSSEEWRVEKNGAGYRISEHKMALQPHIAMRSGIIRSSLFAATDAAGLPDSVAIQIAEIFSTDIDFHQDLRKGDRFAVTYEEYFHEGATIKAGRVLAVEFVNQGKPYRAVYFQGKKADSEGSGGYYTAEGKNLRKAFLRSPIEFSRVSSGFSNARFHPVLKSWRAHKGVDYAAPQGTRIRATANGSVAFAGVQGGYGKLVILQHAGNVTTAYGHLSAFAKGLKKGQRVQQGDVIGLVGATGLASGPHLHYEFRVAGTQRNPLKVAMPTAAPIAADEMAAFHANASPLLARIEMLREINLAYVD